VDRSASSRRGEERSRPSEWECQLHLPGVRARPGCPLRPGPGAGVGLRLGPTFPTASERVLAGCRRSVAPEPSGGTARPANCPRWIRFSPRLPDRPTEFWRLSDRQLKNPR
jgi:hypothetical protein